jgi:hypothetical protein
MVMAMNSSQPIGFITALQGSATATSTDGVTRVLQVGDAVYANETVITGDVSAVMIEFVDGTRLDLGRDATAMLDSEVFTPGGIPEATDESVASIDAIQQAILAGQDPTQVLAATAAGAGGAAGTEGGFEATYVDLTGQQATPTSGFPTEGLSFEFLEPPPALIIVEESPETPDLPSLTIDDVTVYEPSNDYLARTEAYFEQVPTTIATFTVTLSTASSQDVQVDFTTADGTAIANGTGVAEHDYGSTSGTLIIPAGSLEGYIEVAVFGDYVYEISEQYLVNLSNPVNATIADGQGVGTILDAETFPEAVDDENTLPEGSSVDVPVIQGVLANDYGDLPLTITNPGTYSSSLGTLELHVDGSYIYTANPGLNHSSGPLVDSFDYTVQDADGSPATATLYITITDTGATGSTGSADQAEGSSADYVVPGGTSQDSPVTVVAGDYVGTLGTTVTVDAAGNFTYAAAVRDHADGDGKYLEDGADSETFTFDLVDADNSPTTSTFTINITDTGATGSTGSADQAEGSSADYVVPGGTSLDSPVTVVAGDYVGTLGTTVTVDAAGNFTYAAAVRDHADGDGKYLEDGADSETFTFDLVDADNSPTTSTFTINITDTGPEPFTPTASHFVDGTSATNPLNFAAAAGLDGVGEVVFNSFTDGNPAVDSAGNQLTLNGELLYLYYNSATQIEARTGGGDIGFTITLQPGTDSYAINANGVIANGTNIDVSNLAGVGGGNTLFKALNIMISNNVPDTDPNNDVLVSGSDTVNTNATEIGIGDGNSMKNGEHVRFDFVNDLAVDPANSNGTGFVYSTHNSATQYKQKIAWTQGNGGLANLTVSAVIADNDYLFYGDPAGETTLDLAVSNIHIYDAADVEITDPAILSAMLTDNGDSILITGMQEGWWFEIKSTTAFSAVEVDGAAGTDTFKLGVFSFTSLGLADPIDLAYDITASDGDGSVIASVLNATVYPDGEQAIEGTSGDDILTGNGTRDYIFGYDGNDTMSGGDDDDVLIGGAGNDTMTGDAGSDAFVFSALGLTGDDTVTDLEVGDILQFSDVIDTNGNSIAELAELEAMVTVTDAGAGGDVTITFANDPGSSVTLQGIGTGSIDSMQALITQGYTVDIA